MSSKTASGRILGLLLLITAPGCAASANATEGAAPLSRIAFASCIRADRPQPGWESVLRGGPELFLLLGDNVYADTSDPDEFRAAYDELSSEPGFAALRASCPVLATWDDHDYGRNDAGAELPSREVARAAFLDFLGVDAGSPRRSRAGVWHAETFGPPGRRVQVILLDTRYHRSPLRRADSVAPDTGPYVPELDPAATVLGAEQWAWLEARLREPVELRLLVSSIQLVPVEHGWEKWGNMPLERARLIELFGRTGAKGVIVLSGDRHSAEISVLPPGAEGPGPDYPLYEITSSAFNQSLRPNAEPNAYRVSARCFGPNFGTLEIDWEGEPAGLLIEIRGADGSVFAAQRVTLRSLGSKVP